METKGDDDELEERAVFESHGDAGEGLVHAHQEEVLVPRGDHPPSEKKVPMVFLPHEFGGEVPTMFFISEAGTTLFHWSVGSCFFLFSFSELSFILFFSRAAELEYFHKTANVVLIGWPDELW